MAENENSSTSTDAGAGLSRRIGMIAGIGEAAGGALQAILAYQAAQDAREAEAERQRRVAAEMETVQRNVAELMRQRDVPSELSERILSNFPQIFSKFAEQTVPIFESLLDPRVKREIAEVAEVPSIEDIFSIATDQATQDTTNNVNRFLNAREAIAPGTAKLDRERFEQIQDLNPDRLGQAEIEATARRMATVLPAGTVQPGTAGVAGGLQRPFALYRNLISGLYQQRRQDFINASTGYIQEQTNSAQRQQSRAQEFIASNLQREGVAGQREAIKLDREKLISELGMFSSEFLGTNLQQLLRTGSTYATQAATADVELQQRDIGFQQDMLRILAAGLTPRDVVDPNTGTLIGQGITNAFQGLQNIANAYGQNRNNTNNG